MEKRTFVVSNSMLLLSLALYTVAVAYGSLFWTDVISPFGSAFALIILVWVFLKTGSMRWNYLFLALASLAWVIGDIIWALDDFIFMVDPEKSELLTYIYTVPNVFIAVSVGTFLVYQAKKWNRIQLVLDIFAIVFIFISIVWIVFFDREFKMIFKMSTESITTFASIVLDVFSIVGVTVWFASIRKGKVSNYTFVFIAGIILYTMADFFYMYLYAFNLYIPNSVVDIFYMASFITIAIAGTHECYRPKESVYNTGVSETVNIGSSRKGLVLLAVPLAMVFFKGFNVYEIIFLMGVIFVHQILSNYVQYSIKNEQLLEKEKQINALLEESILERTRELISTNRELNILSKQDSITSLYNRRYFMERFDKMLQEAGTSNRVVLFFADLDRFKAINDSHGHDIGDQVLMEVANRFKAWNRYDALLARFGGDEFVIAFSGRYGDDEITGMAKEVIDCCSEPVVSEPYQFLITMSLGITKYPSDAMERSTLMKNADIAMYYAKARGHNNYVFFSSYLNDKIQRKHEIEHLLKKADYDSEFTLFYQPQMEIKTGKVTGVEALLRWNSPEKGPIPPLEFIPIAEEADIIIPIGEWVMKSAVRQIAEWNIKYGTQFKMGINISPKQLDTMNFMNDIKSVIHKYGVSPEWLDIEITESIAMKGETAMEEILAAITGLGLSISIDDFGTGYSSLSYIKRFSIDRLKIAKPLVDSIATEHSDVEIIRAIIMMAKAMGIKTIAEGVEKEEQLKLLAELECDEVQGYFYSPPVSAAKFEEEYLRRQFARTYKTH